MKADAKYQIVRDSDSTLVMVHLGKKDYYTVISELSEEFAFRKAPENSHL